MNIERSGSDSYANVREADRVKESSDLGMNNFQSSTFSKRVLMILLVIVQSIIGKPDLNMKAISKNHL